ncbi:unnamed protein product [Leptosia nina]|uniref:Uncharacterized protein n=1 Tax=Leptosia nina TaxID=320188 RepID=A0AAV1JA31_9NEOP
MCRRAPILAAKYIILNVTSKVSRERQHLPSSLRHRIGAHRGAELAQSVSCRFPALEDHSASSALPASNFSLLRSTVIVITNSVTLREPKREWCARRGGAMAARRLVLNGLTAEVSAQPGAGDERRRDPPSPEFYHELELYRQLLALEPPPTDGEIRSPSPSASSELAASFLRSAKPARVLTRRRTLRRDINSWTRPPPLPPPLSNSHESPLESRRSALLCGA